MVDQAYRTIVGVSEGFYKEKGSKFISYAYPITSNDDVKSYISKLKKQYHDARHHCYAFILRDSTNLIARANDNGEPGHSAGDPILGQIKSLELENVLVVVIRYFGGTKLGVSGLINAYKTAAKEALSKAKITQIVIKEDIKISYPYDKTNEVLKLVSEFRIEIVDQAFEEYCLIMGRVLPSQIKPLSEDVKIISNVTIEVL